MAALDEEELRRRKKIIRIVWIVFAILAALATFFLPGILVEKNRQEREGLGSGFPASPVSVFSAGGDVTVTWTQLPPPITIPVDRAR
jgi:hypothetical protein